MSFSGEPGGPYALRSGTGDVQKEIEASGFAKFCEHGHLMHTPNNAPLPAHTALYHDHDYLPEFTTPHAPGRVFWQRHAKDLTARGIGVWDTATFLARNNGHVKMCPHGALVGSITHGDEAFNHDCSVAHTQEGMQGVERNMSHDEIENAVRQHLARSQSLDEVDYRDPRSEKELVDQEPERAQRIRENIAKVVKVADSPRVQNSGYTTKLFKANTMPNPLYGQYWNPVYANSDEGHHTVIAYHNNKAVGHLTYDETGYVHGMYLDKEHHNGPASLMMLSTAHKHLLQLDNPLGMLKSPHTTGYSAPLIRKVDPDSTYLRSPGNGVGSPRNGGFTYESHELNDRGLPVDLENNEKRSHKEWQELVETTGRNLHSLLAASPDAKNRGMADLRQADPTALLINRSLGKDARGNDERNNFGSDPEPNGPVIPVDEALTRARALLKTPKQSQQ